MTSLLLEQLINGSAVQQYHITATLLTRPSTIILTQLSSRLIVDLDSD